MMSLKVLGELPLGRWKGPRGLTVVVLLGEGLVGVVGVKLLGKQGWAGWKIGDFFVADV